MGLNNAGIHVLMGRCNSSHQSTNCAIRFNVSANQPSKGRLLGQAMASQLCKRVGRKVVETKKWCLRKSGGDEKVVFTKSGVYEKVGETKKWWRRKSGVCGETVCLVYKFILLGE